jgi:hypothetical protein
MNIPIKRGPGYRSLALVVLGAGLLAGCGTLQPLSTAVNSSVSSFQASSTSLSNQGGSVTLSWTAKDALTYQLSEQEPGATVNLPLSSGQTQTTVNLPRNFGPSPVSYTFTLTATGSNGSTPSTQQVTVTEQGVSENTVSLGLSGGPEYAVATDPSGNVWVATLESSVSSGVLVAEYNGQTVIPYSLSFLGTSPEVSAMTTDQQGNLWLGVSWQTSTSSTRSYGVLEIPKGTLAANVSTASLFTNTDLKGTVTGLTADPSGNIWATASSGSGSLSIGGLGSALVEIPAGASASSFGSSTAKAFLLTDILSVTSDAQGNLWALSFSTNGFEVNEIPAGMSPSSFTASTPYLFSNSQSLVQLLGSDVLPLSSVFNSIAVDASGNVWVSAPLSHQVVEIPAGMSAGAFNKAIVAEPGNFTYTSLPVGVSLAVDTQGNVLVGGLSSLLTLPEILKNSSPDFPVELSLIPAGTSAQNYSSGFQNSFQSSLLQGAALSAPAIDSQGNVWFVSYGKSSANLTELEGVLGPGLAN